MCNIGRAKTISTGATLGQRFVGVNNLEFVLTSWHALALNNVTQHIRHCWKGFSRHVVIPKPYSEKLQFYVVFCCFFWWKFNISKLGLTGSTTANRRWRLMSAKVVSCCVCDITKNRDNAWRAIFNFDWQLGRYKPSFPFTIEFHGLT